MRHSCAGLNGFGINGVILGGNGWDWNLGGNRYRWWWKKGGNWRRAGGGASSASAGNLTRGSRAGIGIGGAHRARKHRGNIKNWIKALVALVRAAVPTPVCHN